MDIDSKPSAQDPVPEVEIYFRLLIIHTLLNSSESYTRALQLAKETSEKIQQLNRRSMDPIAAKVWYAVDRAYELGGELADARPYALPLPLLHLVFLTLFLGFYSLPNAPPLLDMMTSLKRL
jgi:26S proteasome regulatory subunit N3